MRDPKHVIIINYNMLMRKVETLETNKSLASRPPKAYTFPAQLRFDIPSPAVMTLLWLGEAQPAPSVFFPFGARHIISHGNGTNKHRVQHVYLQYGIVRNVSTPCGHCPVLPCALLPLLPNTTPRGNPGKANFSHKSSPAFLFSLFFFFFLLLTFRPFPSPWLPAC
ncbi:hypothetical protein ASPVEDRAFT_445964 [Aspergillus versicolor CBS 583.65]|uniref:Uncharacterized protein n=1 Tax=Aspergillus versicolor CBS 583.65 TaxID=1036611 RepID=A0A1L9P9C0_ASPVE|nr:uncharacterized protein ASPVEDRAFT_445964 [Aspergillus versicolor CBS 583.65]OJI98129.1 hypothetical protein ASPVEDRAFT_445964 [Aspergillus versicolor CBS 583.65]